MSTIAETATLAFGYTMADIDKAATRATRLHRGVNLDHDEAHATAWHGVVLVLYDDAKDAPSFYELVQGGLRALARENGRVRSNHGVNTAGAGTAPNFVRYWGVRHQRVDFTDLIAERLALPNVLSVLTPKQYEAISVFAAFDNDRQAAAAALGANQGAFDANLYSARRRALAAWFDDESPQQARGGKDTCRHGHSRATYGYKDASGKLRCEMCVKSAARRASRSYEVRRKEREAGALPSAGPDQAMVRAARLTPQDTTQRDTQIRSRRAEGASMSTIAAEVGCSVSTVHRVLSKPA